MFGWGDLPQGLYADLNGGDPLIVPLLHLDGRWRDMTADQYERAGKPAVAFRCAQFSTDDADLGCCNLRDAERPGACDNFPCFATGAGGRLFADGPVELATHSLERCTWSRVVVVPDDHEVLQLRDDAGVVDEWDDLNEEQQRVVSAIHDPDRA